MFSFALFAACGEKDPAGGFSSAECEDTTESDLSLLQLGVLDGAEYVSCEYFPEGEGGDPQFLSYSGNTTVVSGGSVGLDIDWSGVDSLADADVLVGIQGQQAHYRTQWDTSDNPLVAEFYVSPGASGDFTALLALEVDGVVGEVLEIPFDVIAVGSGDVQVNVNWDQPVDLDLWVQAPGEDWIGWSNRSSPSGGQLDLDSNAGCSLDNVQSENIYWDEGAPSGTYAVAVDYFSNCGVTDNVEYRVTTIVDGEVTAVNGTLVPSDAAGLKRQVLTFEVE